MAAAAVSATGAAMTELADSSVVEVSVWTDGYEGRILQWEENRWLAFDYANFRHVFSAPQQLNVNDLRVLRARFRVPQERLSDQELPMTAPPVLARLRGRDA
jgi:hypothetical protein